MSSSSSSFQLKSGGGVLGGAGNQVIGENKGLESEGKDDNVTSGRKVADWRSLFSASSDQSLSYFPP